MSSLRKWRFPILIGGGLIAAGILLYFSNTHVSTDKTQGAIGKRDVYRDGQVDSADVAAPGSSPVATEAILESSEFKSLAKDQAFQELVHSSEFTELSRQHSFALLLSDPNFRLLALNPQFASMLRGSVFQAALRSHADLNSAIRSSQEYKALAQNAPLEAVLRSDSFQAMGRFQLFGSLLQKSYFQAVMGSQRFALLASQASFVNALQNGTAARMTANVTRQ
jgi:hypothetical protein